MDSFVETVTESMSKGDDVALVGFGTLSFAKRTARISRNFKTKEIINVPKSKTARFKAGKKLKDAVKS